MAQVINTNVASLFGQQALNKSASGLQTAMQRLSSGLRINSAKDDPTGMVTAAGYDSQVRGANQAMRNANDGISTAQINDGYHQQVLENLQRLREIAVQLGGTAAGVRRHGAGRGKHPHPGPGRQHRHGRGEFQRRHLHRRRHQGRHRRRLGDHPDRRRDHRRHHRPRHLRRRHGDLLVRRRQPGRAIGEYRGPTAG
jgi:hypothetical protein